MAFAVTQMDKATGLDRVVAVLAVKPDVSSSQKVTEVAEAALREWDALPTETKEMELALVVSADNIKEAQLVRVPDVFRTVFTPAQHALMETGPVRLAVLAADGRTKLKTMLLPPPDVAGGVRLSWDETGTFDYKFEDGGQGTRTIEKPHIPKLTLKWAPYNETENEDCTGTSCFGCPQSDKCTGNAPLGIANGQRPTAKELVSTLGAPYWGHLRVSPGKDAGGFTASKVEIKELALHKRTGITEALEATFYGSEGRSNRTLEAF